MTHLRPFAVAAVLAALAAARPAAAQSSAYCQWTGYAGGGTWNTPNNWMGLGGTSGGRLPSNQLATVLTISGSWVMTQNYGVPFQLTRVNFSNGQIVLGGFPLDFHNSPIGTPEINEDVSSVVAVSN